MIRLLRRQLSEKITGMLVIGTVKKLLFLPRYFWTIAKKNIAAVHIPSECGASFHRRNRVK